MVKKTTWDKICIIKLLPFKGSCYDCNCMDFFLTNRFPIKFTPTAHEAVQTEGNGMHVMGKNLRLCFIPDFSESKNGLFVLEVTSEYHLFQSPCHGQECLSPD